MTDDGVAGYELLDELARGGSSTVYRARQDALDRDVALKILTAELSDEQVRERFRRECTLLGKISQHPHVVDVHDAGATPDGHGYLVMPLYRRGTLADRLAAEGPRPVEEVIQIGRDIAGALAHAHSLGIAHRDVKPENILIADSGEVLLSDFGAAVAAVLDPDAIPPERAYTPWHAAPEVLEFGHYGPTADVYALASTLYMCLTGEAPFQEESAAKQLIAVLRGPWPPLTRTDVPVNVSFALQTAMDVRPAARYQHTTAFADALAGTATRLTSGSAITMALPVIKDPTTSDDTATDPPGPEDAQTAATTPNETASRARTEVYAWSARTESFPASARTEIMPEAARTEIMPSAAQGSGSAGSGRERVDLDSRAASPFAPRVPSPLQPTLVDAHPATRSSSLSSSSLSTGSLSLGSMNAVPAPLFTPTPSMPASAGAAPAPSAGFSTAIAESAEPVSIRPAKAARPVMAPRPPRPPRAAKPPQPPKPQGPPKPTHPLWLSALPAAMLASLVSVSTVSPWGATVMMTVVLTVISTIDRIAYAWFRHRTEKGKTWTEWPFALLTSPLRLVTAAIVELIASTLALAVGASTGVTLTSLWTYDSTGHIAAGRQVSVPLVLAISGFAMGVTAWFGPGGTRLRRVTHLVSQRAVRERSGRWLTLAVPLIVALAAYAALKSGAGTEWGPLPTPDQLLHQLRTGR